MPHGVSKKWGRRGLEERAGLVCRKLWTLSPSLPEPGVVTHACNTSSTGEVEAGALEVQGHPQRPKELEARVTDCNDSVTKGKNQGPVRWLSR